MLVLENAKSEVGVIWNVNLIIKHEEVLGKGPVGRKCGIRCGRSIEVRCR